MYTIPLSIGFFIQVFIVYLAMLIVMSSESVLGAMLLLVYFAAAWSITKSMFEREAEDKQNRVIHFNSDNPFQAYGVLVSAFSNQAKCNHSKHDDIKTDVTTGFANLFGHAEFLPIELIDHDINLVDDRKRTLSCALLATTKRGYKIYVFVGSESQQELLFTNWWIVIEGVKNPNAVLKKYAFAPLLLPLLFSAFLRKKLLISKGITTIETGFFSEVDIVNLVKSAQSVAFDAYVAGLEQSGVDVTELKAQKSNVLNINIHGGQNRFGNFVQGAVGRVAGNRS